MWRSGSINSRTFWPTVFLLLSSARKRASGRRLRQDEIFNSASGRKQGSSFPAGLRLFFLTLFGIVLNLLGPAGIYFAVISGQQLDAERAGKIVVSTDLIQNFSAIKKMIIDKKFDESDPRYERILKDLAKSEAKESLVSVELELARIRKEIEEHTEEEFVSYQDAQPGLDGLPNSGAVVRFLGAIYLFWWLSVLIFQGEGLELDIQRSRHPMWEWLFSHPVIPGAVFMAEMLAPIAANPICLTIPFFIISLYALVYGVWLGILAGLLIGIPLMVGTACLGKSIEIAISLRCSRSSRSAFISLLSWYGFSGPYIYLFAAIFFLPAILRHASSYVIVAADAVPLPFLNLFLGARNDGSFSLLSGIGFVFLFSCTLILMAISIAVWGAKKGLVAEGGANLVLTRNEFTQKTKFGPLYRKEILWFLRDRGAIVQAVLIPSTVAGMEVLRMHNSFRIVAAQWNHVAGAAVIFGSYFLWVLGPKSLASEGDALWITETWPHGLQKLLKAKAWLWSLIASGMVGVILFITALLFPAEAIKILIVGIGWMLFSYTTSIRSVSLVSKPASPGETVKKNQGIGSSFGLLTFAFSIITLNWQYAVVGLVYSAMTAAGMWQMLRYRLPYLFDPWSEKPVPSPTIVEATFAMAGLLDLSILIFFIMRAVDSTENATAMLPISNAFCCVAVFLICGIYFSTKNVMANDIWFWSVVSTKETSSTAAQSTFNKKLKLALLSVICGALIGCGTGFLISILSNISLMSGLVHENQIYFSNVMRFKWTYTPIALIVISLTEEYIFRGLLFRALDKEWGTRYAVLVSSILFAIFSPPLLWIPSALLGVCCALGFKYTRSLNTSIIIHAAYYAAMIWSLSVVGN